MKKIILILAVVLLSSCTTREIPTVFTQEALSDSLLTREGTNLTFQEILNKHKGKKIVIDIWASWCGDCIRGLPKVKTLQKNNPEVVYLFLSLDKTTKAWERGIEKYRITGEHYFIKSGYRGGFGSFVRIDWIPRYMVIDEQGNIDLFKSIKADDTKIKELLKK